MRLRRLAILASLGASLLAGPATAAKVVTLDDLLSAATLESAWFSPDGSKIAYVRSGTAASDRNEGLFDPRLYAGRVVVEDAAGGHAVEIGRVGGRRYHPVMPFNPDSGGAWAPSGRGLLLTSAAEGAYGLAYWRADTGRLVDLPGRPESSFPVFAWAGERLIYAALAEGVPQRNASLGLLKNLQGQWMAAWNGPGAPPTVSSANPIFPESAPPPGRLMIADLATGRAQRLAQGDYGAIYMSPDGRRFAAIRYAEALADAVFPVGRRGVLEVFEIGSNGAVHSYPKLDIDTQSIVWSPSGRSLLVGGKAAGDAQPVLFQIDPASGAIRRIAPAGLSFGDPEIGKASGLFQIGWIGETPAAIAARPDVGAEAAPLEHRSLDYGEHRRMRRDLYVFAGERTTNLTAASKAGAAEFLAPAGKAVAYVIYDGALFRVAPDREPERLSQAGGFAIAGFAREPRYPPPPIDSVRFSAGRTERLAVLATGVGGLETMALDVATGRITPLPGDGELVAYSPDLSRSVRRHIERWMARFDLSGPASRTLATANAGLADRAWATPTRFDYSVGGQKLTGWLLAPPQAAASAPPPAVVVVYGGQVFGDAPPSESLGDPYLPLFSGQLLAAQGVAVIYPSLPLDTGAAQDLKTQLGEETVAAVDILAQAGRIDGTRVAVMGQSFGGYSTAAILAARAERFRAGVALAGIYDWAYGYGGLTPERWLSRDGRTAFGFPAKGQAGLANPFWQDPEAYRRASPAYSVDKMDAPLLILQGDLDDAFFDASRMYNALARAGKKPVLVRYWGEGHLALSTAAVRDQWARITTWLSTYLGAPIRPATDAAGDLQHPHPQAKSRPPIGKAARSPKVSAGVIL